MSSIAQPLLLTGATGLIGHQLARALIEREISCRALLRDPSMLDGHGLEQTLCWMKDS